MAAHEQNLTLLDDEPLIDFCRLFECQVARTPNAIAIFFEDDAFTYDQLNAAANRIAHHLLSLNTTPEQRIGICLDRSFDAVATMLGILKAGCAFVPLDPEFPIDRLKYIIEDADIFHIVSDTSYGSSFEDIPSNPTVWNVDEMTARSFNQSHPHRDIAPNNLAYIMYTSGSTGKPKGVQIEHRSLATYCYADIEVYQIDNRDRTLQFSTLNFDIAIEEIFPPLLTGGSVCIRPRTRCHASNELSTIVDRYGVTAIHLATAYWHEWVDLMIATDGSVPTSLRLVVVTGEKVSAEHYRRWNSICTQDVLWCNAYGPTEATVSATVFIPNGNWDGDNMPIGKPIKRYDTLIIDAEGKPVAPGETGELLIGGPALARGYLNRPELTKSAFVTREPNGNGNAQRYYRTGDLSRWLPTGDIEFAGRIDQQIKLGSYRIEPGEIEAILNQHSHVDESLITYEEVQGKKHLIAYVARGSKELEPSFLATYLKDQLPQYMVPNRYVLIESFPKTLNGKVDRTALPPPDESRVSRHEDFVAATSDLERRLAGIWSDVLNLPDVGIHDDFFALGGSSLLVTRVIAQISRQLKVEIPVRDFFANPTVASISQHITILASPNKANPQNNHLSRELRAKLPVVCPAYFQSHGYDLFGVRYLPVGKRIDHAVLICPAYGHEYARAHRNLQQLAIQLAQAGCDVLRFDYSATGNSTGDCEEASLSNWRKDIAAAAQFLRDKSRTFRLSIVGVRLGATLANSSHVPDVDTVVLWDPISEGAVMCQLLDEMHDRTLVGFSRFNAVRKRTELDQSYGFCMTPQKRSEFHELRLRTTTQCARRRVVIASREYATDEAIADLPIHWEFRSTADEIYWHEPAYAESAFSSPEAYANIVNVLTHGEDR